MKFLHVCNCSFYVVDLAPRHGLADSGLEIRWKQGFIQLSTGPDFYPAYYKLGTWSLTWVTRVRGVALTTQTHLESTFK